MNYIQNQNQKVVLLTQEEIDLQMDEIKTIKNKVTNISNQLNPILEEFQKAYINYHMNPTNNEYEQTLYNANSNMQSLNSQLFSMDSFLIKNIRKLDRLLMILNQWIQKEKKNTKKLNTSYDQTNHSQSGSAGMVLEFNELYNRDYRRNLSLFLGILISLFLTIRIFNRPTSFS